MGAEKVLMEQTFLSAAEQDGNEPVGSSDSMDIAQRKDSGQRNPELEVFVGGLPAFVADEAVCNHLKQCGQICKFNMPRGKDGRHRGKAFVEFDCQGACRKAL